MMRLTPFLFALFFFVAPGVAASELVATLSQDHGPVPPGHSITILVPHDEERIPLVTILNVQISGTALYHIRRVTAHTIAIQIYNYGSYPQWGRVVLGIWE